MKATSEIGSVNIKKIILESFVIHVHEGPMQRKKSAKIRQTTTNKMVKDQDVQDICWMVYGEGLSFRSMKKLDC